MKLNISFALINLIILISTAFSIKVKTALAQNEYSSLSEMTRKYNPSKIKDYLFIN